ncbi:hypothetical protein Tco_0417299 [Tanacetum coccineum]
MLKSRHLIGSSHKIDSLSKEFAVNSPEVSSCHSNALSNLSLHLYPVADNDSLMEEIDLFLAVDGSIHQDCGLSKTSSLSVLSFQSRERRISRKKTGKTNQKRQNRDADEKCVETKAKSKVMSSERGKRRRREERGWRSKKKQRGLFMPCGGRYLSDLNNLGLKWELRNVINEEELGKGTGLVSNLITGLGMGRQRWMVCGCKLRYVPPLGGVYVAVYEYGGRGGGFVGGAGGVGMGGLFIGDTGEDTGCMSQPDWPAVIVINHYQTPQITADQSGCDTQPDVPTLTCA